MIFIIGIITYALFVFWVCGGISVLIDSDHILSLFGRKPPFKLSESYGRPLHTRIVFVLASFFVSIIVVSYVYGLYQRILLRLGEGEVLLLMIALNIFTYYIVKYLGNKFLWRLINQRCEWRVEKREEKNFRK